MLKLMDQYSDDEFARIIEESYSYKECLANLGYKSFSGDSIKLLKEKIALLGLSAEHFTSSTPRTLTPEMIFCENGTVEQSVLRRHYLKGEYTPYVCSICGQEPEWQGKPLTLILDHINGINKDDRLENLRWVCPNCNQQLDTTNGKNKIRKELKPVNVCIDCGAPISRGAVRCKKCSSKQQVTDIPVSRDQLKQDIRTMRFTDIGRKYGYSDNAIRKWCIKYGLPSKVTDIKTINNEDWEISSSLIFNTKAADSGFNSQRRHQRGVSPRFYPFHRLSPVLGLAYQNQEYPEQVKWPVLSHKQDYAGSVTPARNHVSLRR